MLSRRKWIQKMALGAGAMSLTFKGASAAFQSCGLTPAQTEGPFYPIEDQPDKDNDLTNIKGSGKVATGEVIYINGIVTDEECHPVKGALVEIWQACATGKYNHPGDPNPASLDPDFQYWGRAISNSKGEYSFKTIRPGHYQATDTWMRPAHIHLKVHRRGYEELTSQMYFSDDPYNKNDRILQGLAQEEREKVIVNFDGGSGQFNIAIKSF